MTSARKWGPLITVSSWVVILICLLILVRCEGMK